MQVVTVKCVMCERNIDGYFKDDNKQQLLSISQNKLMAIPGTYKSKKGYIHVACQAGLDAELEVHQDKNQDKKG